MLCISDYVSAICNQCGATSKIACISTTQYFVCNAALQADVTSFMTCPAGMYCTDTIPPCSAAPPLPALPSSLAVCQSLPLVSVATTTTMVPTVTSATATAWCQTKALGRYAQPGDKTCTNYVYCYLNGGTMGWVYSCIGTTLFNPATGTCQVGYVCV